MNKNVENQQEHISPRLRVKTKTWIENAEGELLFGKGKTEILELIDIEGSISKASEKMGINYKKAWNHVQLLERNIDDPMVAKKQGNTSVSGTTLTSTAKEFMAKYRQLQAEIETFANEKFIEIFSNTTHQK